MESHDGTNHFDPTLRSRYDDEKSPKHLQCWRSIPSSGGTAEEVPKEIPTELLNKILKALRPQKPGCQLIFVGCLWTWQSQVGSDGHRGRVDRKDVPYYLVMTMGNSSCKAAERPRGRSKRCHSRFKSKSDLRVLVYL